MKLGDEAGARLLLRLLFSGEPTARAGAEEALRTALDDPQRSKQSHGPPTRGAALDTLPQKRAEQVAAMRATWRKLVEEAEAARERAAARDSVLDALTKYDFAEEAATRYAALDARGFAVDFQRTTSGADELSQRLWDDSAFRGGLASRDLLSAVERRGVSISPDTECGILRAGKADARIAERGDRRLHQLWPRRRRRLGGHDGMVARLRARVRHHS